MIAKNDAHLTKTRSGTLVPVLRLIASRGLTAVLRALILPVTWPLAYIQSRPRGLAFAPQDIRTADPTIADDIYAGYFSFTGKVVKLNGQSPFAIEPPSREWARQLHSFRWLRHLRAADTALSKLNARALIDDWLSTPELDPVAWQPDIAARRLISWLSQSPLILEGVDAAYYRKFLRAVGVHIRFLKRCLSGNVQGHARLLAHIALTQAALCCEGLSGLQKSASRNLIRELNLQILRDGGHLSRNPQTLIDITLDLLPLRQVFVARGLAPSRDLQNALDRIMPMLRMFRHTDGTLALFHGMGVTSPKVMATLFAYDEAQVTPVLNADLSGFQRLEAGKSVLLIDTGTSPPPGFNIQAHASALAFEFSHGTQKIFTNCGAAEHHRPDMREAGRLSVAHNAVVLDNLSSAEVLSGVFARFFGPQLINGPKKINLEACNVQMSAEVTGSQIDAMHDGYRATHQALLRRCLQLSHDGLLLQGTEEVLPLKAKAPLNIQVTLRLHLEPATRIERLQNSSGVHLTLADGGIWSFKVPSEQILVEESILFADPSGARRTSQLVVSTTADKIEWSLQHVGQASHESESNLDESAPDADLIEALSA